jgi:eukaryotic-like serine/threonine-protein kinase
LLQKPVLITIVLTTATIFLFVILTGNQGQTSHITNTFAQEEFEAYENEEFGFTLEHPSNWEVTEPSSYEIQLVGHRPYAIRMELPSSLEDDVATRTNRPMVEIGTDTSDSNSLEQYVSERIDAIVSYATNINSNETTLAGQPAIKVDSTYPGGNLKRTSIYTTTDGETIYNIDYSAHIDKFDTYLPIAQKIIDSFRITEGGAVEGGQGEEQGDGEDQANEE